MNPFSKETLSKASTLGVSLGIGGVALFVTLWLVLGSVGVEQIPRLLISLCLPPAIMAGVLGGYMLLVRPRP
jgi:hypothetical protein